MVTNCDVCKRQICKYELDFAQTGAIIVDVGHGDDVKDINVCYDCARVIAKEFVDEA